MVLLHIFHGGGGGPTFSRGGGPIETNITFSFDFPRTLWHFGTNRLRLACVAAF